MLVARIAAMTEAVRVYGVCKEQTVRHADNSRNTGLVVASPAREGISMEAGTSTVPWAQHSTDAYPSGTFRLR